MQKKAHQNTTQNSIMFTTDCQLNTYQVCFEHSFILFDSHDILLKLLLQSLSSDNKSEPSIMSVIIIMPPLWHSTSQTETHKVSTGFVMLWC